MQHPRLAERLYGTPLLLMPDKAFVIERVFASYEEGKQGDLPRHEVEREHAALLIPARRTENGYSVTDRGVAIVSVMGSLVQRAGGLDALSGLTGYNMVTQRIDAALRDPMVRGIVLDIDSPGGEVAGAFQLADYIAQATKPVWAVANELAASAAYLIASAAERLYMPSSAQVGSVGVVMLHQDRSESIAKSGVRYTPIYAGAKKIDGTSLMPLSEGARLDLQGRVDEVYALFVDAVVGHRGLKAAAVRATEGGMLSTERAIADGFADEMGTLTDAISAMQAEVAQHGYRFQPRASRAFEEELTMSQQAKETPAAPATTTATVDQLAAERAAGYAQAEKDLAPKVRADGVAAERERVKVITTCEAAKDRPALAAHIAFETDMTAEAAQAMLAKAAPEGQAKPANMLDAAMRGTNPKVGADGEPVAAPAKSRISAATIYDIRSKAHGA